MASCTASPLSKTAHLKDPIGGSSAAVSASALPSRSVEECRPASPDLHESGGAEGHELGPWTVVQRRKKKAAPRGSSMPGPGGVAPAEVQHGDGKCEAACVAEVAIPQVVDQQLVFGGFRAVAEDSSGRATGGGRGTSHRISRRSSPSHSAPSQDLDRGLCEIPLPDLSLMVQDAPLGTIVPYCQRLYEDVLPPHDYEEAELLLLEGSLDPVEGGLVEGQRSLKVERMLKDLGPISSLPRKRRLIALDPDSGEASPSLLP